MSAAPAPAANHTAPWRTILCWGGGKVIATEDDREHLRSNPVLYQLIYGGKGFMPPKGADVLGGGVARVPVQQGDQTLALHPHISLGILFGDRGLGRLRQQRCELEGQLRRSDGGLDVVAPEKQGSLAGRGPEHDMFCVPAGAGVYSRGRNAYKTQVYFM